ncbi:MAG: hypothetical protein KQI35_16965 [Bacteroidetes bacterium]|nr:hypothetical protein [Bacteroidota bacterium]
MAENDQSNVQFIEIPPIFYSDLTGEPFHECINCGKNLLLPGTPYMIEKAFIQTQPHQTKNTVFEYAMCFDCWEITKKSLSKESMEKINAYFARNVNLEERRKKFENNKNIDDWLKECIVSGESVKSMKEYQIACQCDGPYMAYHYLPYLISGEVMDEVMELLSEKTLGEMDNFKKRLTSPSPDIEELFNRKKVLPL